MERIGEDLLLVTKLHHGAKIHHADLIRNELDHRQIVGNEQVGQVHGSLQLLEQVDDLRLDRYVERRNRLVANHKLRVYRESAGNADSLTLTARELVGIALIVVIAQSAFLHQIQHVVSYLALGYDIVNLHRLGQNIAYGASGRQRGIGILEDDLHLGADIPHLCRLIIGDVLAVKNDLTAVGLMKLENSTTQSGLSASRLAYDTKGLACLEGEGNVIHGNQALQNLTRERLLDGKALLQVTNLQKCLGVIRLLQILRLLRLALCLFLGGDRLVIVARGAFIDFIDGFLICHIHHFSSLYK